MENTPEELTTEQRLDNIENALTEAIKRIEFVMGKIRIGVTEFSKTLGNDGKPIPMRTREGSLLDFYMDEKLQQELNNATQANQGK